MMPTGSNMASLYPNQRHINDNYDVVGFISSGTYGRVYKARNKVIRASAGQPSSSQTAVAKGGRPEAFAIKK